MTSAPLLEHQDWMMHPGERAALEKVLTQLRPAISIELGTFRGGSLSRIAALSGQVHSFDLTLQIDADQYPNVTFHTGNSHELLPQVLATLEPGSLTFALVDADHTPEGARRDVLDLLSSPAFGSGAILLHDAGNEAVRRGLLSIPYADFPHVAEVDLDFVAAPPREGRTALIWGGMGLIVMDENRTGPGASPSAESEERDLWAYVREGKRLARRAAGMTLRRFGLHPSQRRH
jgi:hypothetical protein